MSKKKIGTVWLGGCSGCHMSLLDIDERLLEVVKLADIVKSPVVDGKDFPPWISRWWKAPSPARSIWPRSSISEKTPRFWWPLAIAPSPPTCPLSATKSAPMCVCEGPMWKPKAMFRGSSLRRRPGRLSPLPKVMPLHQVVKVDYYLPGCPPDADLIFEVLFALLTDKVPDLPNERKAAYG